MNFGIVAVILLLLATTRATTNGRTFGNGTITYDGYWRRYSKFNTSTDYDYVCIIRGQDKNGNPLSVISPDNDCTKRIIDGRPHCSKYDKRRDAWSFSKDPQLAFDDAWSNYLSQGGQPALNWSVKETPKFIDYANRERSRGAWLSALQFFFPNMKLRILEKIPVDLQDKITIVNDILT